MAQNQNSRLVTLLIIAAVVALAIGAVAGGIAGGIAGYRLASDRLSERPLPATNFNAGAQQAGMTQATPLSMPVQESSETVDAVQKAGPAVVTVITTLPRPTGQQRSQSPVDPTASGSGIILDTAGNILTNNHVIDGYVKVQVIFADGSQADAKVVGADALADLAVLKVDVPVPAVAVIGNSDALTPGQHVLAIGSALGDFRNTVTYGIVSGIGRRLPGVDYRLDDLIQTDAAINHGNSGGPLINLAGQVVGINVAIYRGSGLTDDTTVEGVGFAIPIDTAKLVADQIINSGKVTRAYIGVSYQMLTPQLASFYKTKEQQGAYVTNVIAGTPADKAGMKAEDVIVEIGGKKLSDTYSLFAALLRYKPGDSVPMKLMRGSDQIPVSVVLVERPSDLQ